MGWKSGYSPNLSASLPLQAEPFYDRKTRPFFAGLLPEGQMRRLIAQRFLVSGQNDFALLEHIGGDCAGAVTFLAPGQVLPEPTRNDDLQWLSDEEVVAILDELPRRPCWQAKTACVFPWRVPRTNFRWYSMVLALGCSSMARRGLASTQKTPRIAANPPRE
jgi:HipA-like protein